MKVKDIFECIPGNSLELVDMTTNNKEGVNFVSRTSTNNGVVGLVDILPNLTPFPQGYLTVALSGNGVCSTFIQTKPFYTAYHIMVLKPKIELSFCEKMFYALCIKSNAYRYAWGRQANKTLKELELPNKIPKWVNDASITPIETNIEKNTVLTLETYKWKEFMVCDLFNVERGTRLTKEHRTPGEIPLITAGFQNEGIADYIQTDSNKLYNNNITIDMFGNAFFRDYNFYCDDNILVLSSKERLSKYAMLFITTILRLDAYRYSYGRQYRQRDCKSHMIKLPVTADETPDYVYMENYIKSLPYSDKL